MKEKQDKLNYFSLTEHRITRQDNLFDFGYLEEQESTIFTVAHWSELLDGSYDPAQVAGMTFFLSPDLRN